MVKPILKLNTIKMKKALTVLVLINLTLTAALFLAVLINQIFKFI